MNMYEKAMSMNQARATVNSNRKNKIRVSLLLAILLVLPLFVRSPYLLHVVIITALYIILAAALRLPLITGRFNIGIVAFAAVGAYTSALLALKMGVNVWLALLAGCAASGVVAFGLGLIILRVSGLYFGMLTMCLLEMLRYYLLWHRELTGGVMGILNIPSPTIWGFDLGADKVPFYYLTMIVTVFSIWFIYRIERSRAGMAFQAIGQSDLLSEHLGINIARYRLLAFVDQWYLCRTYGRHDCSLPALHLPRGLDHYAVPHYPDFHGRGGTGFTLGAHCWDLGVNDPQ